MKWKVHWTFFAKYNDTGSKDDYLFDMTGSSYHTPYEQIHPLYFTSNYNDTGSKT